jgi:hypothetical protein
MFDDFFPKCSNLAMFNTIEISDMNIVTDPSTEDACEDIQNAVSTCRPIRPHGPYRVQIGNERLEYRSVVINDPVPTGLQILEAAHARPADEHLVFQVLGNGLLEELRPDETADLRTKGIEKFLVFRNDRSFRFELDGRIFEWGGTLISGMTLKKLAEVDLATYGVWLNVPHGEHRLIGDNELIDLSAPGVEKFCTDIRVITIIVNGRPREVRQTQLSFVEIVKLAFPEAVFNEITVYTVTFKRGPADRPEGSLVEGESVHLKNGMVFNVSATDKS